MTNSGFFANFGYAPLVVQAVSLVGRPTAFVFKNLGIIR